MLALAVGLAFALASAASVAQNLADPDLRVTPWLTRPHIVDPMAIRFTGPGEGFLIERAGKVSRFSNGTLTNLLDVTVAPGQERGLLGLAVHPNFSANPFVYIYYTAGD